jgi:hypothetical protein
MKNDNVIKYEAMNILLKHLSPVDTERFIAMISKDKFNYTEWQKSLWNDKTIEEIHKMGIEFEKNRKVDYNELKNVFKK